MLLVRPGEDGAALERAPAAFAPPALPSSVGPAPAHPRGSVADKLVRGAEVPVLVYRPAGRRKTKMLLRSRSGSRTQGATREV